MIILFLKEILALFPRYPEEGSDASSIKKQDILDILSKKLFITKNKYNNENNINNFIIYRKFIE